MTSANHPERGADPSCLSLLGQVSLPQNPSANNDTRQAQDHGEVLTYCACRSRFNRPFPTEYGSLDVVYWPARVPYLAVRRLAQNCKAGREVSFLHPTLDLLSR